jgi:pyruvate-formate lyase-activating enzyme
LRILARLVMWCDGCLRHCRCCCHWRHWVLREKGGVRAVVKAPGRRSFKTRKSPSVSIRKGENWRTAAAV